VQAAPCLAREGIIKCKVSPPRKLSSSFSVQKRSIVGTWVVDKVRKAVEMDHKLVEELEFWEYKVTCFDKGSNSGGLFASYVNMFLKLKQESLGYPSWGQSDEDKDRYIEEYRRAEGIALDKASISQNAGQRTLAKL
jgi:hypothetical protein